MVKRVVHNVDLCDIGICATFTQLRLDDDVMRLLKSIHEHGLMFPNQGISLMSFQSVCESYWSNPLS